MEDEVDAPRAFISYSWTTPEHVEWVIELAEELVENGVEVVFDQWDLNEGGDMYAFMEQMVTDPEIDKVVIICDEEYARKADEREGGVGTETQIVSRDLYDEVDPDDPQTKFVAVVTEKNDEGRAYLPTYMRNRLYIDMSTPDLRMDHFEQLIRWLYDRPLHQRPERGKPPEYLTQDDGPDMGTSSRSQRAKKMLREGDTAAAGAVRDYFETFAENLERFEIEPENGRPFHEQVVESIETFLPVRNEAVDLFITLAKYCDHDELYAALHDYFERLLPYTIGKHPRNTHDTSADNLAFIVYELFLYAVAALFKYERFAGAAFLVGRGYYLGDVSHGMEEGVRPFTWFRPYPRSLEKDRSRERRRISVTADLIEARATRQDLTHDDVMQADLIMYLRYEADQRFRGIQHIRTWHPYSLLYAGRRDRPFELFARAVQDGSYFRRLGSVLGRSNKDELTALINAIKGDNALPRFDRPVRISRLVGLM
jgi:hypothetical protein